MTRSSSIQITVKPNLLGDILEMLFFVLIIMEAIDTAASISVG